MSVHRVNSVMDDAAICGATVGSPGTCGSTVNSYVDCEAGLAVSRSYREWIDWPTDPGWWWMRVDADGYQPREQIVKASKSLAAKSVVVECIGDRRIFEHGQVRGVKFQRARVEPPR